MQVEFEKLLNDAADLTDGSVAYITTVRFSVTQNEVFMDLYRVAPDHTNLSEARAERVERIAMPLAAAKDFAIKLQRGIERWEEVSGRRLSLTEDEPAEED